MVDCFEVCCSKIQIGKKNLKLYKSYNVYVDLINFYKNQGLFKIKL